MRNLLTFVCWLIVVLAYRQLVTVLLRRALRQMRRRARDSVDQALLSMHWSSVAASGCEHQNNTPVENSLLGVVAHLCLDCDQALPADFVAKSSGGNHSINARRRGTASGIIQVQHNMSAPEIVQRISEAYARYAGLPPMILGPGAEYTIVGERGPETVTRGTYYDAYGNEVNTTSITYAKYVELGYGRREQL